MSQALFSDGKNTPRATGACKKEPPQPVCGGSFHEGGAPSELALEGVGYQVR